MKSFLHTFKPIRQLLTLMVVSLGLTACQKPISEEIPTESPNPTQNQNTTPDLDLICQKLKKEMLGITAQRTTFAIEQINQDIRLCLPLMPFQEQKELIGLADIMYRNFLSIDRSPDQQKAFDLYAHDQSQFPTIQQSQIEKLHPRDQYLLRHKGQAYIDLVDINHQATYQRNPYYLARVFAPYFPEAEQAFMQELAEQNQQAQFEDPHFHLEAQEISRRAQYWENYLKKYPQSSFRLDAEYLYHFYSNLLFKGLKHDPVSHDFEGRVEIAPDALAEIEQLANMKNSRLADQARLFLKFIELDSQQKSKLTSNQTDQNPQVLIQLSRYLNLKTVDLENRRNCFKDAICYAS